MTEQPMNPDSLPLLHHALESPSAFTPERLMDAVRTERGLTRDAVPPLCVLDFDGDLSDHLAEQGVSTPLTSWACFHTSMRVLTLGAALRVSVSRGAVWTTDAPYRETSDQLRMWAERGVLAVEMQVASLFAFAQARAAQVGMVALVSNGVDQIDSGFDTGGHEFRIQMLAAVARGAQSYLEGCQERSPQARPHGMRCSSFNVEVPMMKRLTVGAALMLMVAFTFTTRSLNLSTDVAARAPTAQSSQQREQTQSNIQEMMKMHEQMMAEMKAADSKLDALVKDMNAATGDAKVNAVAVVVTELVRQQKSMHDRMGQMHQQMMGGRGMMMKK
jgi:hypothetical protein